MLRIKKLDTFILKSFSLLFIGTFFICLFIFMMQFLWRYVDELVGKGLEMNILGQFFYYSALTLVPMALPLAILLAALITFGNFGERYELLAMKAAGISLIEIMKPLIVLVTMLCCISFFFQNVVGPHAQLKLYTLLYSMRQKSPEVEIPEGVFYDELPGFNLYVKKKDRKTGMLYDLMIYDLRDGPENALTIYSDSGRLEMTADKQHFYLHLYNGESFQNVKQQATKAENMAYRREIFREKHTIIEFDSDFNMMDESIMSNQSISKNLKMLETSIDSMTILSDSIGRNYYTEAKNGIFQTTHLNKEDTVKIEEAIIDDYNVDSLYNRATLSQKQKILSSASTRADTQGSEWNYKSYTIKNNDHNIRRHKTEWHRKYSISLSCLIFFFIGAPLGSIIRKGGLGMPVIASVLIFIFYYIIDNMGYKMARDGNWIMVAGMWLSTAILAPIGLFLTYKSNKDSVVFNLDAYTAWIKRFFGIRSVRNLFRKDVIINDPDYVRLPAEIEKLTRDCRNYIEKHTLHKAPNYFKLWVTEKQDKEIVRINEHLEEFIDEMSNTHSARILAYLNEYPIIPNAAHTKPFRIEWLNIVTGLIFPVGLFFYFRIWIFRIRLLKDLEKTIKTNQNIQFLIAEDQNL
ncbi:LptF/LptG family permease [Bacteroides sp. 519]|uniref:LptF/LptG family permease n=1 Tax=Bacteroides sp. 519 TaxID=2302937 RepID=UPI0013D42CA9|nr:LptF/LptG family permease [Bacteroides sp. 519]NDV59298.1 YjgP/YjgQ family permease [Bacteroides sp. 519]